MKFIVKFEMKDHNCWDCPLCNGNDICNLLSHMDFEDVDEQLGYCLLKIVEVESDYQKDCERSGY